VTTPLTPPLPLARALAERRLRLRIAIGLYAAFTLVALALAQPHLLTEHTSGNHFALLADSLRAGRLDLGGPPPAYAGHNDFAVYAGRYYVVFPPFPALLLLPIVTLAGGADRVPDGLCFLLVAGLAPAILFLALEKLSRVGDSQRTTVENAILAALFAFGSVYFFCALQGTVWFAAHVVAVVLAALYLRFAIRAERPLLAGVCLALGAATRAPLWFAAPFFVLEALRAAKPSARPEPWQVPLAHWSRIERRRLLSSLARFFLPLVTVGLLLLAFNAARFGEPFESGYRYLDIVWRARIERWGLFSYHYLPRNLGVMLTSLPWIPGEQGALFSINLHGLALWVTTPLYLALFWPRRRSPIRFALLVSALACALPSLFYQNTGWVQFGYRFSNDYAIFLFALLAVGGVALRRGPLLLAGASVLVNLFGALSFNRPSFLSYYYFDPSQRVIYQPD
jgi:hypothetical protein